MYGDSGVWVRTAWVPLDQAANLVLVDEAVENVAPADRPAPGVDRRGPRRVEVGASMRSSPIAVIDVPGEDLFEVASVEDQEVVQTVFSNGAYPVLRIRVRPRGAEWGS